MHVTVIGTGYVGTVTGACLSYLGHKVICVDNDLAKVKKLQHGELPIYEPHLEEVLALSTSNGGSIEFTADLQRAVRQKRHRISSRWAPLPFPMVRPDLTFLEAAARSIGAGMDDSRFRVVVNKSTVPVGSGNLVETLVREGIAEARPEIGAPFSSESPAIPNSCAKAAPWRIRSTPTASWWAPPMKKPWR